MVHCDEKFCRLRERERERERERKKEIGGGRKRVRLSLFVLYVLFLINFPYKKSYIIFYNYILENKCH